MIPTFVTLRHRVTRLGDAPIDDRWSWEDNPYVRAQREADALRSQLTAEAERRFALWFRTYLAS